MLYKILTLIFAFSIVFFFEAGIANADGLDTLIDIARGQKDINRQYEEETEAFENVKKAVDRRQVAMGEKRERVKSIYGDPVIVLKNSDGSGERWVYKPASASFFGGDKIYLFFDRDGKLVDIGKADKS